MDLASRVITSILVRVIRRYKIIVTLLICLLTKSLGPPSRGFPSRALGAFMTALVFVGADV